MSSRCALLIVTVAAMFGFTACGGGSLNSTGGGTTTFTVSASVTGLSSGATVVLQNNAANNLSVTADGTFAFTPVVANGGAYAVTVLTQPTGETCSVGSNSSGTASANVIVTVTCSANTYNVNVVISGLTGTVVLQNNGTDNLTETADGPYTFATPVAIGAGYAVTVLTQPTGETCSVGSNGSGTSTTDVTVNVTCSTTTFTISAAVSGLTGTGLVLQDNLADNLSVTTNGTFPFATKIASGGAYSVSILTQPLGQACTLGSNASGNANADVTVAVTCVTNVVTYSVSAAVTGLTGTLVLQDSNNETLTFTTNTTQTFTTPYVSGSTYSVFVLTQPAGQNCTLSSNATGTILAPVTVTVTCVNVTYQINAAVIGLTGGTLVLQDGASAQLSFTGNTTQTFPTTYTSGQAYAITVLTQPAGQNCTLSSNAVGNITSNITVTASCSPALYTISVNVSGLTGSMVLQDNSTDDLNVTTNGTFPFATQIQAGSNYAVSILTPPSGETCSLGSNASGTANADVTVNVTCSSTTFTISATVSGLAGTVVLQDNGSDDLTFNADGTQPFATKIANNGSYDVEVLTQPSGQNCALSSNHTGAATANVTVTATCSASNTSNEWEWVGGLNTVAGKGAYKFHKFDPTNHPGARNGANMWFDSSNNLWLFGGFGYDATTASTIMNDLWEFNGTQWNWVAGNSANGQGPVYPTNVGDPGTPGSRAYAVTWVDGSGNFWLFGGYGIDVNNLGADTLNDIWEFTGGQWLWMGGSQTSGQKGTYGTQNVFNSANIPGARYDATGYVDAAGHFWMFGGYGEDSAGTTGLLNDLWEFNGTQWAWISGSKTQGQKGTYTANGTPGARLGASSWFDSTGNFWLFGGDAVDSTGAAGPINDVWEFSGTQWTWVGGSNTNDDPGDYGTENVTLSTNLPPSREYATSWVAPSGDVYLFGGIRSGGALFNDMWKYSAGEWTWVNGTDLVYQIGVYGTLGTADPANTPGSRQNAAGAPDTAGNLWLFGGYGLASVPATYEVINDLWKYQP